MSIPPAGGVPAELSLLALFRQRWFVWPLILRVASWLLLAHASEVVVFQDASWQMMAGQGVYGRFASWLAASGDGYYAGPPLYAYMLWISGAAASFFGGHWWLHQLFIKAWLLLADLAVMIYLLRRFPAVARRYWTLWFVPVVAIGQLQPDLFAGLGVLAAFDLATRGHWLGVGVLLGLATDVKPVPLIIFPFLVVHLVRSGLAKALIPLTLGLLAALLVGWAPYALLFPDLGQITAVIRFHVERPVSGLTIPSGLLLIVNAGLAVFELTGRILPWATAAYDAVVRASAAYSIVTVGIITALFASATRSRHWSLAKTFCLPLLAFLASNKVVHEHYILHLVPLAIALGVNLRGTAIAFSVYLLAAGSPLRYVPTQITLPPAVERALLSDPGTFVALAQVAIAGLAALAFGQQVLALGALTLHGKSTDG